MTIKAWVEVGDSGPSKGMYVFSVLPPIGATIDIRDDMGDRQQLEVRAIEIIGVREDDWPSTRDTGGTLDVRLFCSAD